MGEPKNVSRSFGSRGLVLKQDPALLSPDTYAVLTNMVSNIEGNLGIRLGNQRLTSSGAFPPAAGVIHTITSLRTGGTANPTQETLFLGAGQNLFATQSPVPASGASMPFALIAVGISGIGPYPSQRIASDDYAAGGTGAPYKFFASSAAMLKSNGAIAAMQRWGILPPFDPVIPFFGPDPGIPAFSNQAWTPYKWVYTNYNSTMGTESNPSAYMVGQGVTPNGNNIIVPCAGVDDPQVDTLKVYRAGGSFADGLYRYVGSIANPGGSAGAYYNDTHQDSVIASNPILDTDNDPPIPSTLPIPFFAQVTAFNGGTQQQIGFSWLTLNPARGSVASLTTGSVLNISDTNGTGTTEECIIALVDPPNSRIYVFLQQTYSRYSTECSCNVAAGSPANIVLSAFNAMFVAGDKNNPHVLYKSKDGAPESFGVYVTATGTADAINVGNPSDPIMALVEYGGGVLSMNAKSLYFISVSQGAMGVPNRTPALRGLLSKNAWCKVSNQIWYLAYDGIYSYAGGEEVWQSEAIDPLFRGISLNGYGAINLKVGLGNYGADMITMGCNGTEVFVNYMDLNNIPARLRYHTVFKRWSVETIGDPTFDPNLESPTPHTLCAQYAEMDTGRLFLAKLAPDNSQSGLFLDNIGVTDGWTYLPNDGARIPFAFSPAVFAAPPSESRLYSDFSVEVSNSTNVIHIATYFDFTVNQDPVDIFQIGNGARRREPFPFHSGTGVEAYALQLIFSGAATQPVNFYSLTVNYWELAQYRHGLAFDWDDCGYPNEKVFRVLNLEVDTGGVQATLQLQGDGSDFGLPLFVTTTGLDRNRIITLPTDNFMARQVRFVLTPGRGGKTNYYKHQWEFTKEPPAVTYFDSLPIALFNGYSFVKQAWLQYMSNVPITVNFFDGGGYLLYTTTLPAHPIPQRTTERIYLPVSNGTVLNKAKVRRFTVASTDGVTPFRIYKDASRLEWVAYGGPQRSAHQQASLTQLMQPTL